MLDMKIQDLPALRVAAVRHVGPFQGLGPSFEKVCAWAGQNQLFEQATSVIGVFHDDPKTTAAAELRSDAAVTIPDGFSGTLPDGIEITEVAGGRYAVGVMKGSYENLAATYGWIYQTWLTESGLTPADRPSYEVYLNDAATTPPDELLTAIHVPVN